MRRPRLGSRLGAGRPGRRPRLRAPLGVLAALCLGLAAVGVVEGSAPAGAADVEPLRTYRVGSGGDRFSFTDLPHQMAVTDAGLHLVPLVLWQLDDDAAAYAGRFSVDPRSVQRLANGNTLVADRVNGMVVEVRPDGTMAWSYSKADDPDLVWPFSAQRLASGNTLITDRRGTRVFEVDRQKRLVWQYGSTEEWGTGIDRISDPFSAVRLANGNTLICDNKEGNRVIEVRTSDYDPDAPDHGYTPASIVWRYGVDGVIGSGPGLLRSPRSAQRLSNGNTLICDAWTHVVIEVTRDGRIAWQYGQTDQTNEGAPVDGLLKDCNYARRLSDGTTLICDTGNHRVLRVDAQKRTVAEYGTGSLTAGGVTFDEPRSLDITTDGRLVVADEGNARVVELGTAASATATSRPTDCGLRYTKTFVSLKWDVSSADTGTVRLAYRIDAGGWKSAGSSGRFTFPSGTTGWSLSYRVTISSEDRSRGPALTGLTVGFRKGGSGSGDGGSGGGSGSGDGTGSGGSGSGGTSQAGGDGTGSGASSGAGASTSAGSSSGGGSGGPSTGSGSGTGSPDGGSQGDGSGGESTTGDGSGSADGLALAPPAEAAAGAGGESVTGIVVDGPGATVTGTVLAPVEGGGAPGGGGSSTGLGGTGALSAASIATLAILGATVMAMPATLVELRMRWFTGYDHTAHGRST